VGGKAGKVRRGGKEGGREGGKGCQIPIQSNKQIYVSALPSHPLSLLPSPPRSLLQTTAVNSADFAIAQFRFLEPLLLKHGRWSYRRTSKVILYSFYKNIVLTFVLFAYTWLTGFSGQSLLEDYVYTSYNFMLAMPPIW
jgi:hypothetical protein